ncbi:uncharacterized protein LOC134210181 [Armigeres subalbatus]|uniref:uncharacterized protein LOC134210181 n=1 Tax=Armigeres subalbatus TaxID=124917 RepID=UPI002ED04FE0
MVLYLLNGPYKEKQRIYTDASKIGTRCAVGVYVEAHKKRLYFKLEEETSITSAEILAIRIAMGYIEEREMNNVVVLTDSRTACEMLEDVQALRAGPEILAEILCIADRRNTSLQWVPSHTDLNGNEIADELAKLGLTCDDPPVYRNRILRTDSQFRLKNIKQEKAENWYQQYSAEKGKKYYEIQPSFDLEPWFTKTDMSGPDIRLTNRLMAGHDFSKYWLGKMKLTESENCDTCHVPETAEHTILRCPVYDTIRANYSFGTKFTSLTELYKTKQKELYSEVIKFVRQTNLNL